MRRFLFVAVLAAVPVIASADETKKPVSPLPFSDIQCIANNKTVLDDMYFGNDGIRVNNIILKEGYDPVNRVPALILTATVANRSNENIVASIEVFGVSGSSPRLAVSAFSGNELVYSNQNRELRSATYAPVGTLAAATSLCLTANAIVSLRP